MFPLPGPAGYDSEEVKKLVHEEFDASISMMAQITQDRDIRMRMSEQPAECSVCGEQLLPGDPNHHVADPAPNDFRHYCGKHCPACNHNGPME